MVLYNQGPNLRINCVQTKIIGFTHLAFKAVKQGTISAVLVKCTFSQGINESLIFDLRVSLEFCWQWVRMQPNLLSFLETWISESIRGVNQLVSRF